MWISILAVAAGGAIGAVSRFLLSDFVQNKMHSGFPYGTMVVNLLGTFLIGFLMIYFLDEYSLPLWTKLMIVTGFLGSLTTFSTFTLEWVLLMQSGDYLGAALYTGVQLVAGFVFCLIGMALGRVVF